MVSQRLAESAAAIIAKHAKKGRYSHVVAANSVFPRDALIRAAALNGHQPISDVASVESKSVFVRPVYAGNTIMTVQSNDDVTYLTVRTTAFAPAELANEMAPVKMKDVIKGDRPDLRTASRVVMGGRGLKSKEDFEKVLHPLADSLKTAVGASRAAVDSGYADNSLQVGQTGQVVAPELYMAVGISGAIQYLAGMKDSKTIAAINKDAEAPIFQLADVGLVGDLFEAVPELTRALSAD
ncbi:putative electron transfer flavoprotein subunit alpha [Paramyrothecium foliicola]|nr:putative electron transfer flavoprotein subunit alpha [Paramyrothecium foliicola]